jgi:hypothetical protein
VGIKYFDSVEDMQEYLRKQRFLADLLIKDWQRTTKPGNCVVRFWQEGPEIFTLYYEIMPLDPDDEPLDPNYRLVCGYSEIEPGGELGVEHISTFTAPITRETFNALRAIGWPDLSHFLNRS